MGISKIDYRCDLYVLSELVYWIFVPMGVLYLESLGFLIICLILVIWNLTFYKNWTLFPNKVVYFSRLFSQIGIVFFNILMTLFYLS